MRDAATPGPACSQIIPIVNFPAGDEACLVLNVQTPDPPPPTPAPVMVCIHGGAFTSGDGRQFAGGTDGREIVRRTGTVVVSINYRLGTRGFLAHPTLTAEDAAHPASGNYGFEDQIAALGEPDYTPAKRVLADGVTGYWTRFAATGDPNGAGAVAWPPLDDARRHLVLCDPIELDDHAKGSRCDFWRGIDYLRAPLE